MTAALLPLLPPPLIPTDTLHLLIMTWKLTFSQTLSGTSAVRRRRRPARGFACLPLFLRFPAPVAAEEDDAQGDQDQSANDAADHERRVVVARAVGVVVFDDVVAGGDGGVHVREADGGERGGEGLALGDVQAAGVVGVEGAEAGLVELVFVVAVRGDERC